MYIKIGSITIAVAADIVINETDLETATYRNGQFFELDNILSTYHKFLLIGIQPSVCFPPHRRAVTAPVITAQILHRMTRDLNFGNNIIVDPA